MTSSTRIRFGALTAAAAVVAGGFFAAVPANAATGNLTVVNTTFTEGDWGTGLAVSGDTFTAGSAVTLTLSDSTTGDSEDFVVPAAADPAGSFSTTFVPTLAAAAGDAVSLTATSDAGDDSTSVSITVEPATVVDEPVLEEKGITTSVSTITTADLTDKTKGFDVHASGYTPGETVTVTVDYNGEILTVPGLIVADENGAIDLKQIYLAGGVASAGTLTITATGVDSGVSNTATITVTGDDVVVGDPDAPADLGGSTTAVESTTVVNLPVVSG